MARRAAIMAGAGVRHGSQGTRTGGAAVRSGWWLAVALLGAGCARVRVEPIEVKPIHITIDVNIKVDRELDKFFAFEQEVEKKATEGTPGGTK